MTKGQFALLTAALGLVTMGGAGYFAYASSTPSGSSANGASANGQPTANSGGAITVPSGGSSATPATGGASGGTGGQGGARACRNGEVQVTEKPGQGAAGTVSLMLVFQNVSGNTCTLRGYPGASLVDQNGKDLLDATRVLPDGLAKAPVVVLAPGAQAAALLLWSDVPTGSGSGCAVQNPANLLVTPPNTTQSTQLEIAAGTEVCSAFRIRPVLSGVTSG